MSGRIVHFEIPFDDQDRASVFYEKAFGWQLASMPGMGYTLVTTGPSSNETGPTEPGFINGGMLQRQSPITSPVLTIDVDDIEAALATIGELGGSTVRGKEPVGDMGFAAYFTDSEGNLVGLWQTASG
jgi:predicted enzyme related to lactoylglutathione lyase